MNEKTMKFTDENGNKIEYAILEQKLINSTVVLCQYFGHKKSNFFMLHF